MEVGRIAIGLGFFGLAALSFFSFTDGTRGLTVKNAQLVPMGAGYALLADIENSGGPDRLTGVASESASAVRLMGGTSTDGLVIPANSSPSLAMDGAHGMVMGVQGGTTEGRLVPITLWFEQLGRVTTRARIVDGPKMSHGEGYAVAENEDAPTVNLTASPIDTGWRLEIATENFEFDEANVDGPHQMGTGHAHLYINGLKLMRVYQHSQEIGTLPPGQHELTITLNTNDHRTYVSRGQAISSSVLIMAK